MVAAKIANIKHGENQHMIEDVQIKTSSAAELLNIHKSTVSEAKTVLRDGTPEEIEAVESGKAAVSTTAKKIRARARIRVTFSTLSFVRFLAAK